MPQILSGPFTGSPDTRTDPLCGGCRPEMSLRREDFPQPLGPTIATNSPFSICRLVSESAMTPSVPPYAILTFCRSIIGCCVGAIAGGFDHSPPVVIGFGYFLAAQDPRGGGVRAASGGRNLGSQSNASGGLWEYLIAFTT